MQPPARTTRSKASPGLVDRPSSRRPSAVVAKEKTKKQQAATLKVEELRHRAAQVGEVEKEIRRAQAEVQPVRQGGGGKATKKTFRRPAGDANSVSSRSPCIHKFTDFPTDPQTSPTTTADQGKRNADAADLSEPELMTAAKTAKCVR